MEDRGAEVRDGWDGGVVLGDGESEGEKAVGIRRVSRSSEEDCQVGEVVGGGGGVGGEEVVGWKRVAVQGGVIGSEAAEGTRVLMGD